MVRVLRGPPQSGRGSRSVGQPPAPGPGTALPVGLPGGRPPGSPGPGAAAPGGPATGAHPLTAGAGAGEGAGTAVASSGGASGTGVPISNYAFFVRYTYSNECALLAYNFHKLVTKLGIFDQFVYRHDYRLISVTLAYIFYRYQVHHCDMALDLAVTLVYLEDVRAHPELDMEEHTRDAFNLICYLAFLAHAFNADRTIRLADWYKRLVGALSGTASSSMGTFFSSSPRC